MRNFICSKCGNEQIAVNYRNKDEYIIKHSSSSIFYDKKADHELLLCHCTLCQYEWLEEIEKSVKIIPVKANEKLFNNLVKLITRADDTLDVDMRLGQALSNALEDEGVVNDPFYDDSVIPEFLKELIDRWKD